MHNRIHTTANHLVDGLIQGIVASVDSSFSDDRQQAEAVAELNRLAAEGFSHKEFDTGILTSEDINSAFKRIFYGLRGLYRAFLLSSSTQNKQIRSLESDVVLSDKAALKVLQDIRVFKLLRLNPDFSDLKIISFLDTRNRAPGGSSLKVDVRTGSLRLAEIDRTRLHQRDGETTATVTYLCNGVTGFSRTDQDPSKAVDIDPETFWSETLFSDNPVSSDVGGTTYPGAAVRLVLDLGLSGNANRIDLKPYGDRSPRLLALEVSGDGVTYKSVPGFSEPSLREKWWTFHFAVTTVRYVRVTLLQENYTEQIYHLPKSNIQNNITFDHLLDETTRFVLGGRNDSEVETKESIANKLFGLTLDSIGRLEGEIAKSPLPGDDSARILDVNRILAPIFSALDIKNHPLGDLGRDATITDNQMVEIHKFSYTLGLFHLEVSRVRYQPSGYFESPKFKTEGSVWEVSLDASPTHVNITDSEGGLVPATVAEFSVSVSNDREFPIHPKDDTSIYEIVPINPKTRSGVVRFNNTDSAPRVWWNGRPIIQSEEFTFNSSTRTLNIKEGSFKPSSTYLINYVPTSGQGEVDIRNKYRSRDAVPHEVFFGTGGQTSISLRAAPFVDYDKINNSQLFYKDPNRSRYHFRTGTIDGQPIKQRVIDGEIWGQAVTQLPPHQSSSTGGISPTDVVIPLLSGSQFIDPDTEGVAFSVIQIGSERISYTRKFGNQLGSVLYPCIRGFEGTTAQNHISTAISPTIVVGRGKTIYDPIFVYVDGVEALNQTDYFKQEHPALVPLTGPVRVYNYIQIGSKIYFDSPIPDSSRIEIYYKVLTEHLSLSVRFRQTIPGAKEYTPDLREGILYMNRASI